MTSKAERQRRRRQRKAEEAALTRDPFALADIPQREPNGRFRRLTKDEAADRNALMKRAAMSGLPVNDNTLRDMRAPWWGCNAGRAVAGFTQRDDEREALWCAICHIRRVVTAYDAVIGAPARHAQCLRLLAPVDALEADAASPALDDRTDEERQRQAYAAYEAMRDWLTHADARAMSECVRVVVDDQEARDELGLILALQCVSDGLKGAKVKRRDRY